MEALVILRLWGHHCGQDCYRNPLRCKDCSKHCSRPREAQGMLEAPPKQGSPATTAVVGSHKNARDQVIHPILVIPLQQIMTTCIDVQSLLEAWCA